MIRKTRPEVGGRAPASGSKPQSLTRVISSFARWTVVLLTGTISLETILLDESMNNFTLQSGTREILKQDSCSSIIIFFFTIKKEVLAEI